jgi:PsbP
MRPMLEGLYEPGSPIKFIALDPPPSDGFTTNLNVVVRDAAPGDTVEEFGSPVSLKELKRQAAELLRGPVESDLMDLPAGTAHKLSVQLEFKVLQGQTISVYQEQYEFISGGEYYALIYSTDSDRKSEYQSVFAESARSFKIG